jgi:hypothetical protein
MVCGSCGATIAEKAIVCYRCGTATAIPAPPPKPVQPSARPWPMIVLLVVVAVVLGWLASTEPAGSVRQIVYAVIGVVALAASGAIAWRSGR